MPSSLKHKNAHELKGCNPPASHLCGSGAEFEVTNLEVSRGGIALLYNPTAGEGHAFPEIFRSFAHHGHELVCVVANKAEAERLVERP